MDSRAWRAIYSPWGRKESGTTEVIEHSMFRTLRITVPVSGFSSEAEAWPLRACVSADQLSAGRRLLRAQTLHPAPGGVPHPRRAPL